MHKKSGLLLLCLLLCAFSAGVKGESGVGSLMSSIDNYPEDAADPAKRPLHQTAVPREADALEAEEARGANGDAQTEIDAMAESNLTGYAVQKANAWAKDNETGIAPLQIINEIEEPGLIVEALAGSGARTITVTYMAADDAVGRLDVFAECQKSGVAETWYSEVANLEVGQTGVFELPGEGLCAYRVCVVASDGSGVIVLSISAQ